MMLMIIIFEIFGIKCLVKIFGVDLLSVMEVIINFWFLSFSICFLII